MLKDLIVKSLALTVSDNERTTPVAGGSRAGFRRMARPPEGDLLDVLQKEAERYRSAAWQAASEQERNYLTAMARLSETMAANEKMRTWLDRAIQELRTERVGSPVPN